MISEDKWDDIYPDAIRDHEYPAGVFKAIISAPCFMCGAETDWYDIDYGGPLCGLKCQRCADKESGQPPDE